MKIAQIPDMAERMSIQTILAELERLRDADDASLERLMQKQTYFLLPDTEHSVELLHLVKELRNTGRVEVIADRFEKIPISFVGQACEGYRVYAASLFIALSLLKFTTRYWGRLRCALFVLKDSRQSRVSPLTLWEDACV